MKSDPQIDFHDGLSTLLSCLFEITEGFTNVYKWISHLVSWSEYTHGDGYDLLTGFIGTILQPSFILSCRIVMTLTSRRYGTCFITPMEFNLPASLFKSLSSRWLMMDSDNTPASSSSSKSKESYTVNFGI